MQSPCSPKRCWSNGWKGEEKKKVWYCFVSWCACQVVSGNEFWRCLFLVPSSRFYHLSQSFQSFLGNPAAFPKAALDPGCHAKRTAATAAEEKFGKGWKILSMPLSWTCPGFIDHGTRIEGRLEVTLSDHWRWPCFWTYRQGFWTNYKIVEHSQLPNRFH